jgi:hypothetical protein
MELAGDYRLPRVGAIEDYLSFTGWSRRPPGVAGALWTKGTSRIGIPDYIDDDLLRGIVERISTTEGRRPAEVSDAIRYLFFDVTNLRAANDFRIVDTIPLTAAAQIIGSARTMLRSTATTARRERSQIDGNYSDYGDAVVNEALMGHTEQGSYIIPVLVAIPRPSEPDVHEPTLDEPLFHRAPPEPFERRVVRTFAQSMEALRSVVVEPARRPTPDQLHELVYRGVSREFCTSLADILHEPAVAEFEAQISWSPAISAPEALPKRITIESDAVELVEQVANRLRRQRVDSSRVFSGTIVELRHEADDPFGEIAISTMWKGRSCEIHVRLPVTAYNQAWSWHQSGEAILVEGVVRRAKRHLLVDSPDRVVPLSETVLVTG